MEDFLNWERFRFSGHALDRMFERQLTEDQVKSVARNSIVIREYPTDDPYPSVLVLGFLGTRPIHIVLAINRQNQECIVVTIYEPTSDKWEEGFTKKKRKNQ